MILLGIDYETGEDFDKGKDANFVTEVGLVLYDTEIKQPLDMTSLLVNHGRPLHKRAIELTHITQDMVEKHGHSPEYVASIINYYATRAHACIAHNADFDQYYYKRDLTYFGYTESANKHFIDTMRDVDYPADCHDRSLMYIAAFHKIINFHGHRALMDVMTMLTIMDQYDMEEVYRNSLTGMVAIIAFVTQEENHLAKKQRFTWYSKDRHDCPEEVKGWWAKICKEWELPKKTKDLGFKYEIRRISSVVG